MVVAEDPVEVAGLKLPQLVAPEQVQVTPAFVESLVTVAVMEFWLLVTRGLVTVPTATVTAAGGGVEELLPPHATSAAIALRLIRRRIDLRNVTVHLPWLQSPCFQTCPA